MFRDTSQFTLLSIDDSQEILGGKDANGVSQRAGAELSGKSAISGQFRGP